MATARVRASVSRVIRARALAAEKSDAITSAFTATSLLTGAGVGFLAMVFSIQWRLQGNGIAVADVVKLAAGLVEVGGHRGGDAHKLHTQPPAVGALHLLHKAGGGQGWQVLADPARGYAQAGGDLAGGQAEQLVPSQQTEQFAGVADGARQLIGGGGAHRITPWSNSASRARSPTPQISCTRARPCSQRMRSSSLSKEPLHMNPRCMRICGYGAWPRMASRQPMLWMGYCVKAAKRPMCMSGRLLRKIASIKASLTAARGMVLVVIRTPIRGWKSGLRWPGARPPGPGGPAWPPAWRQGHRRAWHRSRSAAAGRRRSRC